MVVAPSPYFEALQESLEHWTELVESIQLMKSLKQRIVVSQLNQEFTKSNQIKDWLRSFVSQLFPFTNPKDPIQSAQ